MEKGSELGEGTWRRKEREVGGRRSRRIWRKEVK